MWHINAIGNPHTMGRGTSFQISSFNAQMLASFDEYDGHGLTVALGSDDIEMMVGQTDEGCYIQIRGLADPDGLMPGNPVRDGTMIMLCLPVSLLSFINELEMAVERNDYPDGEPDVGDVIPFRPRPALVPDLAPDAHLEAAFDERFDEGDDYGPTNTITED